MGITRTAKGTQSSSAAVTTLSLANVTIAPGATIVFGGASSTGAAATSVTFNGVNLINVGGGLWYLGNVAGATASVTVNTTSAVIAFFVLELAGAAPTPLDQATFASGSSTGPSSGATATTTQAEEIVVGLIAHAGSTLSATATGAWSGGLNAGQYVRSGTSGTQVDLEDGFLAVTTTQAATAAKTGAENKAWVASVATFKAVFPPIPPFPGSQGGIIAQ